LDALLESLPVYMMIGIVVVVGISQINRLIGSALGIVFWIGVAAVGSTAYDKGGGIKLLSFEFSRPIFFLFCGVFVAFNALSLYKAMKLRNVYRNRRRSSSDEE
jgi:hypothetical protein